MRRAPVITPINIRRGWKRASSSRKVWVSTLPFFLVLHIVFLTSYVTSHYISDLLYFIIWVFVSPLAYYATARVVRPYLPTKKPESERTIRHFLASLAVALATPVFIVLYLQHIDMQNIGFERVSKETLVLLVGGTPAGLLGLVTIIWGLLSMMTRSTVYYRSMSTSSKTPPKPAPPPTPPHPVRKKKKK